MRMGSEDRSPVDYAYDDFANEEERLDMWSLMRPEPRSDTFASLLAGDAGKEYKENGTAAAPWDLTPSKAYGPITRSRSSLSDDSLQLCTEGLGCESCDCLTDSASCESSSVIMDDYLSEDEEEVEEMDSFCDVDEDEENNEKEEKNLQSTGPARSFPPPLLSFSTSSTSYMRSFKKDGRFVLQSVKAPLQNYLHSYREGGRLKMHLVNTTDDDDFALPLASQPENEILPEQEYESDKEQPPDISSNSECSAIPPVQESEPHPVHFAKNLSGAVSSLKCNNNAAAEINVACNFPPEKCKAFDYESAAAKREIPEAKSSLKASSGSCVNVYSGWRTELAEQNSSVFCQNWQKAQSLPNYPVKKLTDAEDVKVNKGYMNANEACGRSRVPQLRVNDLVLGRCHEPKSLSIWGKSQCIATSS